MIVAWLPSGIQIKRGGHTLELPLSFLDKAFSTGSYTVKCSIKAGLPLAGQINLVHSNKYTCSIKYL